MHRWLALLLISLSTGCATTLDTSRPIEKGTGLWWGTGQQDGHVLDELDTRARLAEFEVSRAAAERSRTEHYVQGGMLLAGLPLFVAGRVKNNQGLTNVGLGIAVLSIVPGFMRFYDYDRAIDLYNTRFEPGPPVSQLTVVPYLAADEKGGVAGVAGRF
jgi:hypothetical protein